MSFPSLEPEFNQLANNNNYDDYDESQGNYYSNNDPSVGYYSNPTSPTSQVSPGPNNPVNPEQNERFGQSYDNVINIEHFNTLNYNDYTISKINSITMAICHSSFAKYS